MSKEPERPIYFCDGCGNGIYADDIYNDLYGDICCLECADPNSTKHGRKEIVNDSQTRKP